MKILILLINFSIIYSQLNTKNYIFGGNNYGQALYGLNRLPSSLPTITPNFVKFHTGDISSVILDSSGHAYTFGFNGVKINIKI
jgi:alpha-tubulin suppressor-like RCC1 family protein